MDFKNFKYDSSKFSIAITTLLFVFAGFLIFQTYPNISKFQYAYEKGSPWQYETMTAPFAFEIRKSKKELQSEEDSLLKEFHSLYDFKENIGKDNIKKLQEKLGPSSDVIAGMYKKYIIEELDRIYRTGIISTEATEPSSQSGDSIIIILKENISNETPIKKLYTTKSAYEQIIQNAPQFVDRNTLRDYNLNNYLQENILYNQTKTENLKKETLKAISLTKGRIQSGEKIIDHGEIVSTKTYDILNSLKEVIQENSQQRDSNLIAIGQILIICCILCAFFSFLFLFRAKFTLEIKNVAFMLGMIVLLCVATSWMVNHEFSPYIIPYAILPIMVTTFFDTRTALFSHLTTILLCSYIVPNEFEFISIQTIIGMISISTLKNIFLRSQLVKSAILIFITYCTFYLGSILVYDQNGEIDLIPILHFAINCLLLLFAFPLIYIVEKLFGYMSDVTLVELANTNNELLRKFSEVAPGSFQHSMQVSNLASEAALSIGANPMLVRAGALYHDIGKMNNPAFFTENQSSINPHTELNDEEKSAQIIIKHVTDGVAIAKKNGLPEKIQDFILTHHGNGKTKYFYYTLKNKYPDKVIDDSKFTYPGPRPFSKETAILVMCDSVEAASRSLQDYTDQSINDLVENIINSQIQEGTFEDAPITLKQISTIKSVLKEKLKTIYHTRIIYPELNNK
jgi:putative nucleotidyltransferase with HDIG domain